MKKQFPIHSIEHIYVDTDVRNSLKTKTILRALSNIPKTFINDKSRFLKTLLTFPLNKGKKTLWLTRFKGDFLKPCPATKTEYFCCRYWTINVATHCPLDCSYCILQNYLNVPVITVYMNTKKISKEISAKSKENPLRLFRMGTGELSDSLALDPITHINEEMIRPLKQKNILLEIKTKTDFIDHLPAISQKNVILSWSLNPQKFISSQEFRGASLENRLQAALAAIKKGYGTGFHFDPLLLLPNWEKSYTELIEKLCSRLPEEKVFWISLGSLRFPPNLKKIIDDRFPKSLITTADFIKGMDGKTRYFRPQRVALYKHVYESIRKKWKNVFIYFCMENPTVWKDVMGKSPKSNAELDFWFHKNIYSRFPELKTPKPVLRNYEKDRD